MKTPADSSAKKPLSPRELAQLWEQIAFLPTRQRGQNFLVDLSVLERINFLLSDHQAATIVEIGAGLGALTPFLVEQAEKVVSYEIDARLAQVLKERFDYPNWSLVAADFLKSDLSQFKKPTTVVGNIPYALTSRILFHLFRFSSHLSQAVLMLQKEVGQRLAAQPGQAAYGQLTATSNLFCLTQLDQIVRPTSFKPKPKVDSVLVVLTFKPGADYQKNLPVLKFIERCFAHPRKTLLNNLKPHYRSERVVAALKELTLQPTVRAEQLSVQKLRSLYNLLKH